jgi:hypothetical protein
MTDKKSGESRRKLLKSIAAGSGAVIAGKSLPESWKRPIVDSVMLPAHAQTSGCSGCFPHGLGSSIRYTPGTYPEGTVGEFRTTDCSGIGERWVSVEAATPGDAATAYATAYGQCTATIFEVTDITCATVWICYSPPPA